MPLRAVDEPRAIRAFFAVEIGESARRAAAALARALGAGPGGEAVRWVRPEALHVTLRFLGDIDPGRLPDLVRRVGEQTARLRPFRVALGDVCAFPSPRRPRVVALALAPEAPLAALADAVEGGVVAAGLPPELRPFRAHLTLGRVRGRFHLDVTSPVTAESEAFDVAEVVLFRSDLQRSGAKYTPLERVPLGARARAESDHP